MTRAEKITLSVRRTQKLQEFVRCTLDMQNQHSARTDNVIFFSSDNDQIMYMSRICSLAPELIIMQ